MLNNFVFLAIFDNLFQSIKDGGNQLMSIIMYGIGAFLIIIALIMFAVAGYYIHKKQYKQALGKIGGAILVAFIAVLGAGLLFVYANYLSQSAGISKTTTDEAVKNTLGQ